jgi:hypothetical protein
MALELVGDVRRLDGQMLESKPADRRRRGGIQDLAHRDLRSGSSRRLHDHRLHRRRPTFPDRRQLRRLQRHRTERDVVRGRKVHRLSLRGKRQLNHAIHIAAVTQIRHPHSEGRGYYDRKIAEGKTGKMALRALKRQVSKAVYRELVADADRLE